jgi:hypothetical protein
VNDIEKLLLDATKHVADQTSRLTWDEKVGKADERTITAV